MTPRSYVAILAPLIYVPLFLMALTLLHCGGRAAGEICLRFRLSDLFSAWS